MGKLSILVCLPLRRSDNLDLPLLTSMTGNKSSSVGLVCELGSLPLEQGLSVVDRSDWANGGGDVVQLGLCVVHRGDWSDGGGDVR